MPNRLSKILSRSSKDKEAEANTEDDNSSSSSPPPEYAQPLPDYDEENILTPPDLTTGFSNLNLSSQKNDTPQVDHCIAHLKLLECFYRLRQRVASKDGLFCIYNNIVLDKGLPSGDKEARALAKLSEKRWAVYVSRAVGRFEAWINSLFPNPRPLKCAEFMVYGKAGTLCEPTQMSRRLTFNKSNMPPMDVLMVWHAYMLNPRAYLEDCLRNGWMTLWHTGFPWQSAIDCIDSNTFAYEAGDEAATNFARSTNWNQLRDADVARFSCPGCLGGVQSPWTTVSEKAARLLSGCHDWDSLSKGVDNVLSSGRGFADKDFSMRCPYCMTDINHERLKAAKFCNDARKLIKDDVMMPGTPLGYEGIPLKWGKKSDTMFAYFGKMGPFANRFVKLGLGMSIINENAKRNSKCSTMTGIRDQIEKQMTDRRYMSTVKCSFGMPKLSKADRVSIRKMMSRYWENSSPFALDLVGAVIRQGSFIEKMHNIDWLHSPALPNTMKRLLVKYQRFVSIMKDPTHMAVPTLDVDLAWHTHQLSPYPYMAYTIANTGQFIDHDDKVAETALNDAFAWTSKTYQRLYGEPYSECTCWYCEATRESHTNVASRLFNTWSNQANDSLVHRSSQDPRKSVHISVHNAVRPDDTEYAVGARQKAAELEKAYEKACERARKRGRPEPKRDDYYWSDAYGHAVYIPAYSPYVGGYMFMPAYYPVAPACMAMGVGAAGNCCSGTCGGGVAAGACAGAGGGCGGNGAAGGGCAGGGGGCGGGGGGGGGGSRTHDAAPIRLIERITIVASPSPPDQGADRNSGPSRLSDQATLRPTPSPPKDAAKHITGPAPSGDRLTTSVADKREGQGSHEATSGDASEQPSLQGDSSTSGAPAKKKKEKGHTYKGLWKVPSTVRMALQNKSFQEGVVQARRRVSPIARDLQARVLKKDGSAGAEGDRA
ncbi:uncharacterized protein LTR77_007039 [Saxophila tyrrhenica]|uniref:Alpha-ketoglutarate-dependent sulfonate dioxygenase n=1 Tax=Saxophila tyrrhenica TaxID=1690608 RepID=A0AAV9P4A0_9PEZI|nr:hypothetical protein LTR77_007039 [Saxophila tyrrhenica]